MTMPLDERKHRTKRVLARFEHKPFSWSGANCIRLAAAQARAMGHTVPPVPLFRSAAGARRALAKRGAASVPNLLDQYFARWPAPAFALVGDLVVLQGDHCALHAVCISDGRGNVFGWHDDAPGGLSGIKFVAADILAAWRL